MQRYFQIMPKCASGQLCFCHEKQDYSCLCPKYTNKCSISLQKLFIGSVATDTPQTHKMHMVALDISQMYLTNAVQSVSRKFYYFYAIHNQLLKKDHSCFVPMNFFLTDINLWSISFSEATLSKCWYVTWTYHTKCSIDLHLTGTYVN